MRPHERLRSLHGLRGIAVLLVVLFHLFGAGRVSGGIDVFLAVSGFLFTGLIARRLVTDGRVAVLPYLARLVRRLVPPALPVLLFVGILSVTLLPTSARTQTWSEIAATLLYAENVQLIRSQLTYDAAGPETSPLQHFWSLSVQGQFYLLWPVLLGAVWWLLRRRSVRARLRGLTAAVLVVSAASFGYALHLRVHAPEVAYLHTGARLWELALPGLLALVPLGHRLPLPVRVGLGWTGLGLVVLCGFVLDGGALFPGPWALWPVGGLALVLLAGDTGHRWGADRLLGTGPATWLADRSYALYLWHWPLLIAAVAWTGRPGAGTVTLPLAIAVLALSLVAADLTYRWVERPVQQAAPRLDVGRTVALGAAALVPPALALAVAVSVVDADDERRREEILAGPTDEFPGAFALAAGSDHEPSGRLLLEPHLAAEDRAPHYEQTFCHQQSRDEPEFDDALLCPEPDGMEVPDPVARIVITGGSHAGMFEPTWRVLAAEHNWEVLVMIKSGCHLTSNTGQYPETTDVPPTRSCQEWNRQALDLLEELDPDAVFTIATTTADSDRFGERAPRGFRERWDELDERGIDVIAIRDLPHPPDPVPDCIENHREDPSACDAPHPQEPSPITPDMVGDNVHLVDLRPHVCPGEVCPAVIGDIIAYYDASHLSASFARTLAPALEDELRREMPQLFQDGPARHG